MARINFIVPAYARAKFSGGLWCVFEYAHGLHERGHDVRIIPIAPVPALEWFTAPIGNLVAHTEWRLFRHAVSYGVRSVPNLFVRSKRKQSIRDISTKFSFAVMKALPHSVQWGISELFVPSVAPPADINIATSFDTARPTALLHGRNFYFLQHYEPYFANEYPQPAIAERAARQSYGLGLRLIANSSWLKEKIEAETQLSVALCPNAIDHAVFTGAAKKGVDPSKVVVISYGGRKAEWKGFREMASAMAMARSQSPRINIDWRVYGEALLPPDNPIARYLPLGFLPPPELSKEYRNSDILLSASWYESFPLFPIEAMACGIAVITTAFGTEDYAIAGQTAEVVEPRSVESITTGLLRLVNDPDHRFHIATAGQAASTRFTWGNSVSRLESIILA